MSRDRPGRDLARRGEGNTGNPLSIPNLITLGRVIFIPIIFWLLVSGQTRAAFLLFVLAGVTDAVDGWLAKSWNMKTELGAYLDPMADKLLIVSIYVALGVAGQLPSWLVIAVVSRDIPPNTIAAGNPATVIKQLDPEHPITTRAALFESAHGYQQEEERFDQKYLAANTLPGWLRSMWRPDRSM